jgi:hypothetical protein
MAGLSDEEKAICERYHGSLDDIATTYRSMFRPLLFNSDQQLDSLEVIRRKLENLSGPARMNM